MMHDLKKSENLDALVGDCLRVGFFSTLVHILSPSLLV